MMELAVDQGAAETDVTTWNVATWYKALSVEERLICQRGEDHPAIDLETATKRLKRWHTQNPFTKREYFLQRLQSCNTSEEQFLHALGDALHVPSEWNSKLPAWLYRIKEAFDPSARAAVNSNPSHEQKSINLGLLVLVSPLINEALYRFIDKATSLVEQHGELPFDIRTIDQLFLPNLLHRLARMFDRTLVLELNVAKLEGKLVGDTAEQRFNHFIELLSQPDFALRILQEYPVLARQSLICINQWVDFSLEFLANLCKDWVDIKDTFNGGDNPGYITSISAGAGDAHKEGRSVIIVEFKTGLKLVYKPRSLSIEVHFNELLAWLNNYFKPEFRLLKVLDKETYGWVEFVKHQPCRSVDELQRFYKRQGGYLALLYALEATDFHHENIIASGEHPILIDFEALFHYRLETKVNNLEQQTTATKEFFYSVLRVGLLPQRIWANDDSDGIDLSGIGGRGDQLTPFKVLQPENTRTDSMRFVEKHAKIAESHNKPTLNGLHVNVEDYEKDVEEGFSTVYNIILKHRVDFVKSGGLLDSFANDEIRTIFRPTNVYWRVLNESFHPSKLRNAIDRDLLFDRLWLEVEIRPHISKIIQAEQNDLRQGCIPIFLTKPDSNHLWTSEKVLIENFFDTTSLEITRQRLNRMSEDDLARQLWFIKASFATLTVGKGEMSWAGHRTGWAGKSSEDNRLINAAMDVGDRICSLALREKNRASWIGISPMRERVWSLTPMSLDLLSGTSGLALFLAHLGKISKESRYTQMAQMALVTMRSQIDDNIKEQSLKNVGIGAFLGLSGVIYTLASLGVLWDQPELLAEAESILEFFPELITEDYSLDILAGSAGSLCVLGSLYKHYPKDRIVKIAAQCGERLLNYAEQNYTQAYPGDDKTPPLTGFSHGAAGIALGLFKASSLTKDKKFHQAAVQAIEYERNQFIPEVSNWADYREVAQSRSATKPQHMTTWCNGAPGIGLARLSSLGYFKDALIEDEIEAAMQRTLKHGFGLNHSLCHGDLGNAELIVLASEREDTVQLQHYRSQIGGMILESIESHGYLPGTPRGIETPGLMIGLAGIGYGLLRLAKVSQLPSVLSLNI
jgi:type 2 lantibiotic biosynthesis protein LanM